MEKYKRILSMVICLLLIVTISFQPYALETEKGLFESEVNVVDSKLLLDIPDAFDEKIIEEYGLISRNRDEEATLDTVVFKNERGNNVMYTFSCPVKYVAEDGKIYDKTNKILKIDDEKYRYTNKSNDIKTMFPQKIESGIRLDGEGQSITTYPLNVSKGDSSPMLTTYNGQDAVIYEDVFGEKSELVYTLTYSGYKEEIVLSEYYGVNEFSFSVFTNGLDITESWTGELYLTDKNGNFVANIGNQYVITADEANNTMADLSVQTVEKYDKYILTVKLDEEYLTSDKTKYPIRIDPSINFSGMSSVEDVTICSNSTSAPNSNSLYVGKGSSSGTMRTLMKFTNFDDLDINSSQIIHAQVSIRDLLCESYSMDVYCHDFNSIWNVNTVQWGDCISFDNYSPRMNKKRTVSYSKGQGLSTLHRYTYDITALAKEWLTDSNSMAKGIIFKSSDEFESNGELGKYRTFCSSNRANYSNYYPRLTLEYTDKLPDGIYRITETSTFKSLITNKNANGATELTFTQFSNTNENVGDHLWHIKNNADGSYTFTSIGQRTMVSGDDKEYFLGSFASLISITALESNNTKWNANIVSSSVDGVFISEFTNVGTGKKLFMNSNGAISGGTTATRFQLNYIETYTFSDFWDGTYNVGIYDGVAHIKYVIDSSISTSNFFSDSSVCDFSIIKERWNGITDNIVIYGPDDNVPVGITPFVVTFKAGERFGDDERTSKTPGESLPNNLVLDSQNFDKENGENWDNFTIYLNDNCETYYVDQGFSSPNIVNLSPFNGLEEDEFQRLFNTTIVHEFGHALKLAHHSEYQQINDHEFEDARDGLDASFNDEGSYVSSMNNYKISSSRRVQIVSKYDKMNLISKWEYHSECA